LLRSGTSHGKGFTRASLAIGKNSLVDALKRANYEIFDLFVKDLLRSYLTSKHIVE